MPKINYEIERKFLLSGLPPRCKLRRGRSTILIRQGYLPGKNLKIRLRHSVPIQVITGTEGTAKYFWSTKIGKGEKRIELEDRIDKDLFDSLWGRTSGRRVVKYRHLIPNKGLVWEIDVLIDREPDSVVYLAEIELPKQGYKFTIPKWLKPYIVRDVTDDPAYTNSRLAK